MHVKGHIYLNPDVKPEVREYIQFLLDPGSAVWNHGVVENTAVWHQLNRDPKTIGGQLGADGDLFINDDEPDQILFIYFLTWIWFHSHKWDLFIYSQGAKIPIPRTEFGFRWAGQNLKLVSTIDAMRESISVKSS